MTHEVWREVIGYQGYYMISNLGNLKSLDRLVYSNNNAFRESKGREIKTWLSVKGYVHAQLSKNNKKRRISIHRLVAEAFIPNPESKATVNHINGIKTDNRASNLEWHTQKENLKHATDTGLRECANYCKKVFDRCTDRAYTSIKQASLEIGISYDTCRRWIKKGHCLEVR